jgi:hypothetical protein
MSMGDSNLKAFFVPFSTNPCGITHYAIRGRKKLPSVETAVLSWLKNGALSASENPCSSSLAFQARVETILTA